MLRCLSLKSVDSFGEIGCLVNEADHLRVDLALVLAQLIVLGLQSLLIALEFIDLLRKLINQLDFLSLLLRHLIDPLLGFSQPLARFFNFLVAGSDHLHKLVDLLVELTAPVSCIVQLSVQIVVRVLRHIFNVGLTEVVHCFDFLLAEAQPVDHGPQSLHLDLAVVRIDLVADLRERHHFNHADPRLRRLLSCCCILLLAVSFATLKVNRRYGFERHSFLVKVFADGLK